MVSSYILLLIVITNYNCIYLVNQNKFNEASQLLDSALEKIELNYINASALWKLKRVLEANGQTFKYDISVYKNKVCT